MSVLWLLQAANVWRDMFFVIIHVAQLLLQGIAISFPYIKGEPVYPIVKGDKTVRIKALLLSIYRIQTALIVAGPWIPLGHFTQLRNWRLFNHNLCFSNTLLLSQLQDLEIDVSPKRDFLQY